MLESECYNVLRLIGCTVEDHSAIADLISDQLSVSIVTTPNHVLFRTCIAPNNLMCKISIRYPHITFLLSGELVGEFTTKTVIKAGQIMDLEELTIKDQHLSTVFNGYIGDSNGNA